MAMEGAAKVDQIGPIVIGGGTWLPGSNVPATGLPCASGAFRGCSVHQPFDTRLKAMVPITSAIRPSSIRQAAGRAKRGRSSRAP